MTLYDVAMRLTGPVDPVGCSTEDSLRLGNTKELVALTGQLLFKIEELACNADRHEHSVRLIGREAREFLAAVAESLNTAEAERGE